MEVSCMTSIKESNISDLVKDMKKFSSTVKNIKKEDVTRFLIQIGVLDSNGAPKKQICSGSNYAG